LFAGRLDGEKGASVLLQAWRASGLAAQESALVICGDGPIRARAAAAGAFAPGRRDPVELRNSYAGSDVVVVPSVPTRDFLEPWGLVVNEAFHQGVPVIATDAVGAAAGGLVQNERTGLVVPAGDPGALAAALRRLHDDAGLRTRLGAAAREAVAPYSQQAWAAAMSRALAAANGC
jgi:glycosyltransferase involved in cell wall biosynthesis